MLTIDPKKLIPGFDKLPEDKKEKALTTAEIKAEAIKEILGADDEQPSEIDNLISTFEQLAPKKGQNTESITDEQIKEAGKKLDIQLEVVANKIMLILSGVRDNAPECAPAGNVEVSIDMDLKGGDKIRKYIAHKLSLSLAGNPEYKQTMTIVGTDRPVYSKDGKLALEFFEIIIDETGKPRLEYRTKEQKK